jgi:hypothetical protein
LLITEMEHLEGGNCHMFLVFLIGPRIRVQETSNRLRRDYSRLSLCKTDNNPMDLEYVMDENCVINMNGCRLRNKVCICWRMHKRTPTHAHIHIYVHENVIGFISSVQTLYFSVMAYCREYVCLGYWS